MLNLTIDGLPLKCKTNVDMCSLYSRSTNAVAVKYCVLRPQTKNNS